MEPFLAPVPPPRFLAALEDWVGWCHPERSGGNRVLVERGDEHWSAWRPNFFKLRAEHEMFGPLVRNLKRLRAIRSGAEDPGGGSASTFPILSSLPIFGMTRPAAALIIVHGGGRAARAPPLLEMERARSLG